MRNNINRISYGQSAQEPLRIQLRASLKAALQGPCFTVERTLIQKGTDCPMGHTDTKWQSQHANPGGSLPKSHLVFPLLHKSLIAGVFTSHSPLHYLQKVFLLLTLDLKREEYRGKICLEQLYYP